MQHAVGVAVDEAFQELRHEALDLRRGQPRAARVEHAREVVLRVVKDHEDGAAVVGGRVDFVVVWLCVFECVGRGGEGRQWAGP